MKKEFSKFLSIFLSFSIFFNLLLTSQIAVTAVEIDVLVRQERIVGGVIIGSGPGGTPVVSGPIGGTPVVSGPISGGNIIDELDEYFDITLFEHYSLEELVKLGFFIDIDEAVDNYLDYLEGGYALTYKEMVERGYYTTLEEAEFFTNLPDQEWKEISLLLEDEYAWYILPDLYLSSKGIISYFELFEQPYTLISQDDWIWDTSVRPQERIIWFVIPAKFAVTKTFLKAGGVTGVKVRQTLANGSQRWIPVINGHLRGQVGAFGVRYNMAGFPIFASRFTMRLKNADLKQTRGVHISRANAALRQQFNRTAGRMGFSEVQIRDIQAGITPRGLTWHHHQDRGVMQLVNTAHHQANRHTGGFAIWGTR
ncbi:MAG: HNH endonuclease [Turicibacter sp.]|nr:HNH endonuclease [Turicibacter sp.]